LNQQSDDFTFQNEVSTQSFQRQRHTRNLSRRETRRYKNCSN
jgi:hypothetical protein